MPKRPATLDTLLLALELLRRIPRNRKVTSRDLREELHALGFERDERSIQRLLKTLSEHFDIERDDRSQPYGYQWKEQAPGLTLPALNTQESLLLMLAEQHIRPLLPPSVMKSMDGFFKQARNNLAPHTQAKLEKQWLQKVRVVSETQPLLPPKMADGVLAVFPAVLAVTSTPSTMTRPPPLTIVTPFPPVMMLENLPPRDELICTDPSPMTIPPLDTIRVPGGRISETSSTLLVGPQSWLKGDRRFGIPGSVNGNQFNVAFTTAVQKIYDSGQTKPIAFSSGFAIMMWTLLNVRNGKNSLLTDHPLPKIAKEVVAALDAS